MALSAVTLVPKATKDEELDTMSEEQPLEDEQAESLALQRMNDRLFVATTGMLPYFQKRKCEKSSGARVASAKEPP